MQTTCGANVFYRRTAHNVHGVASRIEGLAAQIFPMENNK